MSKLHANPKLHADADEAGAAVLRDAMIRLLARLRDEESPWFGPWEELEEFDLILDNNEAGTALLERLRKAETAIEVGKKSVSENPELERLRP